MNRLRGLKLHTETVMLFFTLMVYKICLEVGYYLILGDKVDQFILDFDSIKYTTGLVWIVMLYALVEQKEGKTSSFFLNFYLFIAIVPMAVYYGIAGGNSACFNLVCMGFAFAEIILKIKLPQKNIPLKIRVGGMPEVILFGCVTTMIGVLALVVATKGLPALTALNLRQVYSIRSENYFISNKYLGYLYSWMMTAMVPFVMAFSLVRRKYFCATLCTMFTFIFYLYSGNKTTLFSMALIVGVYIFMRFSCGRFRFFQVFALGIGAAVLMAWKTAFYMPFSLFVRRTMMVPCQLKFFYYDFFVQNPKLGFSGLFPRSFLGQSPYDESAGVIIGNLYLNSPGTNANTGFMIEGFARFGYVGVFVSFFVFAVILILLDRLQEKTSFIFAVCAGIYPVYTLNDVSLFSSILTGPMLILVIICLFYFNDEIKREKYNHGIKICTG